MNRPFTICIETPITDDLDRDKLYNRAAIRYCIESGVIPFFPRSMDEEDGLRAGGWCDERWYFVDYGVARNMIVAADRAKKDCPFQLMKDVRINQDTPAEADSEGELAQKAGA